MLTKKEATWLALVMVVGAINVDNGISALIDHHGFGWVLLGLGVLCVLLSGSGIWVAGHEGEDSK